MVGGESDEEEVDVLVVLWQEMFNELMNEVKKDKQKNVEAKKNVNVNVEVGTNKNVNKKAEVDDIEDMLANLWSIIIIQFNPQQHIDHHFNVLRNRYCYSSFV